MRQTFLYFYYFGVVVIVFLTDWILSILSPLLVSFECYKTKTEENLSLSVKLVNIIYFNTAFMIYASYVLVNVYNKNSLFEIWQENGLLSDTFWILVSFYFLTPFLEALDIPYLKILFTRWMAQRSICSNNITQKEINTAFEGKEIEFADVYTRFNIVWQLTMFIMPIYPLAPLGFLFYILSMYWITKYIFLRRCKQPAHAGSAIFFYCFNNIKNGIHSFFVRKKIKF